MMPMKPLCSILALLFACAAAPAAEPVPPPPVAEQELRAGMSACEQEQASFAAGSVEPEQGRESLGELSPWRFDPAAPMPAAPAGHSAAVADGGLLYDNARSSLTYLGNVRLNDERVQLRAAYRLYIRLTENEQPKAAPAPAPEPQKSPAAAARPSAPAQPAAPQKAKPLPALITAESAAVDLQESRLLLEGRPGCALTITRGEDSLSTEPVPGAAAATVFASAGGDILIRGRNTTIIWHDAEGSAWRLHIDDGPVYYLAAQRCLVALGPTQLHSPRYTMQAQRALYILLAAEEEPPAQQPERKTPFSQFTTARFRDIEHTYAYGNVRLTCAAEGGVGQPSVLRGEALRYEAASGECRVYGEPCALEYGANTLVAPGSITLMGNGDILVNAPQVTGAYERPFDETAEQGGATTARGTYQAAGPVTYDAQRNCICLPRGISARDAHGAFSCTGQLTAYLSPRPGSSAPRPPRPGMRMPNLAIARQGGISYLTAGGAVRLWSEASATTPAYRLESDYLEADIALGTASLRSGESRRLLASYGEHLLTATPAPAGEAEAHLLSNGDLRVAAAKIHATLPGEDGPTRVDCTETLTLQRTAALLTLGPSSRLASPGGIFTAREPLQAVLEEGDPATTPTPPKKYPNLTYNFTGLRRADTPGGGTLRTPQASMECEGAISIELKPGAQLRGSGGGNDARSALRRASARKRVQVAGKDADGRLIRAAGDRLDFDSASGNFYLRGSTVTLVDEFNSHSASGRGACITIDPHNNVRITGESHTTTATQLQQQMDKEKKHKD